MIRKNWNQTWTSGRSIGNWRAKWWLVTALKKGRSPDCQNAWGGACGVWCVRPSHWMTMVTASQVFRPMTPIPKIPTTAEALRIWIQPTKVCKTGTMFCFGIIYWTLLRFFISIAGRFDFDCVWLSVCVTMQIALIPDQIYACQGPRFKLKFKPLISCSLFIFHLTSKKMHCSSWRNTQNDNSLVTSIHSFSLVCPMIPTATRKPHRTRLIRQKKWNR